MIALLAGARTDFYNPVLHGLENKTNDYLGFPIPVMFLYLLDQLNMLGLEVRKHLGRIAEVVIAFSTLGAFMRTVLHRVLSRVVREDRTRFCGEDGVLIRVDRVSTRKLSDMGIFHVF